MSSDNSFKSKFKILMVGSLFILVALGITILITVLSIQKNKQLSEKISNTANNIYVCQSCMRCFLLNAWSDTLFVSTGASEDLDAFLSSAVIFEKNIKELSEKVNEEELEVVKSLAPSFEVLKKDFLMISALIKERGYKDMGLEGKLREAVHKIENSEALSNKSNILVLRKHEKDFFLRKDFSYINKFKKDLEVLKSQIDQISDESAKTSLTMALDSYNTNLNKIVDLEKQIGLSRTEGLRDEINKLTSSIAKDLNSLSSKFNEKSSTLVTTTIITLSIVFLIIIVLVILALNKLIRPIVEPMQLIQEKATEISEGNLSVKFDDLKGNSILKDLIDGFEKIIIKFRTTMAQIEGISSRTQLVSINVHSEKDEVGHTLNKIIDQIKKIDDEDKKRSWQNEGLAKFSNLLRLNNNDELALYDQLLKELVKYLNANQGGIFIVEGETDKDSHLSMKACYAYERKKYINTRIEYGEGLTGACWAEGEFIYLTEVPENYIRITSGIGEATPKSIIIVPILFNEKVLGVIEIATLFQFEKHQIDFAKLIAESLGSVIHNIQTNTKTNLLLQRSQEMTEELRAQEEEMRQNMEELQATQEEMTRMSTNLQKELEELKQENEELKAGMISNSK